MPPSPTPDTSAPITIRSLVREAGSGGALIVFGGGLGFLASALMARWLGVEGFGIYSVWVTVAAMVAIAAKWGMDHAVYRYVSPRWNRGDREEASALLRILLRIVLVGSGLGAAAVLLGGWALLGQPAVLAAMLVVPLAVAHFLEHAVHATSSYRRALIPNKGIRPVGVLAALAACFLFGVPGTPEWAVWITVGGGLLASVLLYRMLQVRLPTPGPAFGPRRILSYGGQACLFSLAVFFVDDVAILVLGAMGESGEAGIIAAANTLAGAQLVGWGVVGTVAARSYAGAARDPRALQALHLRAGRMGALLTLSTTAVIWALSPALLWVFDFPYGSVAVVLGLWTVGIVWATLFGYVQSLAVYTWRPLVVAASALACGALGVSFALALVGPLGPAAGAATGALLGWMIHPAFLFWLLRRRVGIRWVFSAGWQAEMTAACREGAGAGAEILRAVRVRLRA